MDAAPETALEKPFYKTRQSLEFLQALLNKGYIVVGILDRSLSRARAPGRYLFK
jgi:hypothetical protein